MRREGEKYNGFIGHVGGDDFFLGLKFKDSESSYNIIQKVSHISKTFNKSIRSCYDLEDIQKDYIVSLDRDGIQRKFPIMNISSAILEISSGKRGFNIDQISEKIFKLKKMSKKAINFLEFSKMTE